MIPQVKASKLETLPFPNHDPSRLELKRASQLSKEMRVLNQQLTATKTPDEKTKLERQIASTDRQIDQLVYELYGLTDDEIKIVEGETQRGV